VSKKNHICSFCGKTERDVDRLVQGFDAHICNECVESCYDVLQHTYTKEDILVEDINLLKPMEIKDRLDDYVIGQEDAKKVLSVAVYNHYKRVAYANENPTNDIELQKSNVILIGPTGAGKTLLAETLAKILKVPFAIADATTLTEAGYVGEDVENILLRLIQAADMNIKLAEMGIIYIDEIDKISRKSENVSITRDVSGEGVQQALLKIIEGTEASVPPQGGRKHPSQSMIEINTKNILFIVGGAFEGLDKIIKTRVSQKSIGFGADIKTTAEEEKENIYAKVLPEDLIKYGIIPELIGRLPLVTALEELNEELLIDILTKPKNALVKQYIKFFELENVNLEFEKDAIIEIAKLALKRKIGARGLRAIMENVMLEFMYEIPSQPNIEKLIITKEAIIDKAKAIISKRGEKIA